LANQGDGNGVRPTLEVIQLEKQKAKIKETLVKKLIEIYYLSSFLGKKKHFFFLLRNKKSK